jgi:lipopolysaccharide export system permease protein
VTLLHRYILREVALAILFCIGLFLFVLMAGNVARDMVGLLADGRLTFPAFLRLNALLMPFALSYALPLGVLAGTLVALGRLSAQQEITALRAAGVGVPRLASSILALAVFGAAGSVVMNLHYAPNARTQYRLELGDAVRVNPLNFIVERTFVRDFPGFVFYVSEKEGQRLRDVWIWELDANRRVIKFARAESAFFDYDERAVALNMVLQNVQSELRDTRDPEDFATPRPPLIFERTTVQLPLDRILGRAAFRKKLTWMNFGELMTERERWKQMETDQQDGAATAGRIQTQFVIHEKFAMGMAVISFALIGVPLGIRTGRRETSANLGIALGLALGYYFLTIAISWLDQFPRMRPDLLVWIPNLLFQGIGLWLFARVGRCR